MNRNCEYSTFTTLFMITCMIAPLLMFSSSIGASTSITTFGDGSSESTLDFNGPGEDTSLYLTMPRMSTVSSASMSIEGRSLRAATPSTIDFDFNETTTNIGWGSTTNNNISSSNATPASFQGGGMSGSDYTDLATVDGSVVETIAKGAAFSYQQFKFTVNMAEISQIDVKWRGIGEYYDFVGTGSQYGAQVYLWNNASQQWLEVGTYTSSSGKNFEWLESTFTGILDTYLYNDIEIRVLAETYHGNGATGVPSLKTDFVKVTVTGKTLEWPSDLALDVGDDGSNEWSYTGPLMSKETFSGVDLVTALQSEVDANGSGHGSFDIPLSFSSATGGQVIIGTIAIDLDEYTNQPPDLLDIPDTFSFDEDTDALGLIDLKAYFEDDMDPDSELVFAMENESSPEYIHAQIEPDGSMDFTTLTDDWFGEATFK